MKQIGKMDRVITIQGVTAVTQDANGVPVETWGNLVTLRAKKLEGDAADTEHGGIAVTDTRVKLQTYFYAGLTLENRATYEGATYQIKHLSEIGRRRGLEIHIELLGVPGALGDQ